jgi:hypothetical protein
MRLAVVTTLLFALAFASPVQQDITNLHPSQQSTAASSITTAIASSRTTTLQAREHVDFGTQFFAYILTLLHLSFVHDEIQRSFARWQTWRKKEDKKIRKAHLNKITDIGLFDD